MSDQPTRRAGTKTTELAVSQRDLFTYSRMRERVKSGPLGFLFRETRSPVHFHFHFHFHFHSASTNRVLASFLTPCLTLPLSTRPLRT